MPNNTKNFSVSEFACHCGCGFNIIDQRIIDMAQTIREAVGVPVHVNSGCRCEHRNASSGGVKGSFHTKGLAADLSCSAGAKKLFAVVADLKARGKLPALEYAILYSQKDFVHIDCGKPRSIFFEVRP
jgi:uncharacterized protein YcbK (DUF882 family)